MPRAADRSTSALSEIGPNCFSFIFISGVRVSASIACEVFGCKNKVIRSVLLNSLRQLWVSDPFVGLLLNLVISLVNTATEKYPFD